MDAEALAAENARLARINQQLLSEKGSGEEARAENRELRRLVLELNRGGGAAESREDQVDWRETVRTLETSDDPRDKFTLAIAQELHQTKQTLRVLTEGGEVKIPSKDIEAVQQMLATGDYRTSRAAYKALLGERFEKMQANGGAPPKDAPAPKKGAAAAPAAPRVRSARSPVRCRATRLRSARPSRQRSTASFSQASRVPSGDRSVSGAKSKSSPDDR